jgi:hypothetical protein
MSTALMTRALKGQDGRVPPDPEVPDRPKRRRFTAEHKLAILKEAEVACAVSGRTSRAIPSGFAGG